MPENFSRELTNGNDGVRMILIADEYEDAIEFRLTEGLGNFSVVRIFIDDNDEARVVVERFTPDQENYDVPEESLELLLFGIRTLDGRNGW